MIAHIREAWRRTRFLVVLIRTAIETERRAQEVAAVGSHHHPVESDRGAPIGATPPSTPAQSGFDGMVVRPPPTQEDAQRALRNAKRRYGFALDAEKAAGVFHHVMPGAGNAHTTDGHRACWCNPARHCAMCGALGPCTHGRDRAEIVLHRRAS